MSVSRRDSHCATAESIPETLTAHRVTAASPPVRLNSAVKLHRAGN